MNDKLMSLQEHVAREINWLANKKYNLYHVDKDVSMDLAQIAIAAVNSYKHTLPTNYDADKDALKRRVREFEEVVEKYRTKRIGPYEISIKISGPNWNGIIDYIKWFAKNGEKCGPDGIGIAGSDSSGYGWSFDIKSNIIGGEGEASKDEIQPEISDMGKVD